MSSHGPTRLARSRCPRPGIDYPRNARRSGPFTEPGNSFTKNRISGGPSDPPFQRQDPEARVLHRDAQAVFPHRLTGKRDRSLQAVVLVRNAPSGQRELRSDHDPAGRDVVPEHADLGLELVDPVLHQVANRHNYDDAAVLPVAECGSMVTTPWPFRRNTGLVLASSPQWSGREMSAPSQVGEPFRGGGDWRDRDDSNPNL